MAIQTINIGTTANDNTGDSLRSAGQKLNENFTDSANAASRLVTTSSTDTTAGRLLKVGDFGVGGVLDITGGDLDNVTNIGFYSVSDTTLNRPTGNSGTLLVTKRADSRVNQKFSLVDGSGVVREYSRVSYSSSPTLWSPWQEILHTGNTGTAVNSDVTTSSTDTTAGRLLKVGDAGMLGRVPLISVSIDTFNIPRGEYFTTTGTSGTFPNGNAAFGVLTTSYVTNDIQQQVFRKGNSVSIDSYNRMYIRTGYAGSVNQWSDWQEILHTGNMVGTVNSSKTGAIIERGSNANGEYVKFADGTLICWIQTSLTQTNSGRYNVSYPASFSDATSSFRCAFGSEDQGESFTRFYNVSSVSTASTTTFSAYLGVGSLSYPIRYTVIGRWY